MSPTIGRRALLGGAAGLLLASCGTASPETTGAPAAKGTGLTRITYAKDHPDQFGVFGLPSEVPKGLAVLVHGGFWSDQYGAGLMDAMGADLRKRGYATWNVEYRRVGSGGGFPETFLDIAMAFDKVADLDVPTGVPVFSLGHSAGGHLGVWAASRSAKTPGGAAKITPATTISLSGVLDLTSAAAQGLGGGAADALMGEEPFQFADPCILVPAKGRVLTVHAEDDEIVPRDQSTTYVKLDTAAGGNAVLSLVPGGHFDLIDPTSDAWAEIVKLLPQ